MGALGTFFVNTMAVISYRQVLFAEGYEAALDDHFLWGYMLLVVMVFGPGRISLDHMLERRAARATQAGLGGRSPARPGNGGDPVVYCAPLQGSPQTGVRRAQN